MPLDLSFPVITSKKSRDWYLRPAAALVLVLAFLLDRICIDD